MAYKLRFSGRRENQKWLTNHFVNKSKQTLRVNNLFDKRGVDPPSSVQEEGREVFETLLSASVQPGGVVRLERIMSFAAENGGWYDQAWDEWVMVVRGEAVLEWDCEGGATTSLEVGDYLLIGAGRRHRVLRTSYDCVWLALHLGQV